MDKSLTGTKNVQPYFSIPLFKERERKKWCTFRDNSRLFIKSFTVMNIMFTS